MQNPYRYRCRCQSVWTVAVRATGLVRVWGTTTYAPRFEHTCPHCGTTNIVHDGLVLWSWTPGQEEK